MKYIGKQTRRAPHALIFCRIISEKKRIKQTKKMNDMVVLVLKISLFRNSMQGDFAGYAV